MKVEIIVERMTDPKWVGIAAAYTTADKDKEIKAPLSKWLASEHSPIRCLWFAIRFHGLPNYVAKHLVRHSVGCVPFEKSMRPDRGGPKNVTRMTPTNLLLTANAQSLINISRRRLCTQASSDTRKIWENVREAVRIVCPELADAMVPECEYRGRCTEFKSCGRKKA